MERFGGEENRDVAFEGVKLCVKIGNKVVKAVAFFPAFKKKDGAFLSTLAPGYASEVHTPPRGADLFFLQIVFAVFIFLFKLFVLFLHFFQPKWCGKCTIFADKCSSQGP